MHVQLDFKQTDTIATCIDQQQTHCVFHFQLSHASAPFVFGWSASAATCSHVYSAVTTVDCLNPGMYKPNSNIQMHFPTLICCVGRLRVFGQCHCLTQTRNWTRLPGPVHLWSLCISCGMVHQHLWPGLLPALLRKSHALQLSLLGKELPAFPWYMVNSHNQGSHRQLPAPFAQYSRVSISAWL